MKTWLFVLICIAATFSVIGCSGSDGNSEPPLKGEKPSVTEGDPNDPNLKAPEDRGGGSGKSEGQG